MAYISSLWTQCVQCISTVTVPPTGAAVSVVDPECEEMGGGGWIFYSTLQQRCVPSGLILDTGITTELANSSHTLVYRPNSSFKELYSLFTCKDSIFGSSLTER